MFDKKFVRNVALNALLAGLAAAVPAAAQMLQRKLNETDAIQPQQDTGSKT